MQLQNHHEVVKYQNVAVNYYIMRTVVFVRVFVCLPFMAAASRTAFEKLRIEKLDVIPSS